jgi:hypothetical protein
MRAELNGALPGLDWVEIKERNPGVIKLTWTEAAPDKPSPD